jgi:hypothetical protein
MCSVWGSIAKHVIEQPQPVQGTTHEEDIADSIGEYMAKVKMTRNAGAFPSACRSLHSNNR